MMLLSYLLRALTWFATASRIYGCPGPVLVITSVEVNSIQRFPYGLLIVGQRLNPGSVVGGNISPRGRPHARLRVQAIQAQEAESEFSASEPQSGRMFDM